MTFVKVHIRNPFSEKNKVQCKKKKTSYLKNPVHQQFAQMWTSHLMRPLPDYTSHSQDHIFLRTVPEYGKLMFTLIKQTGLRFHIRSWAWIWLHLTIKLLPVPTLFCSVVMVTSPNLCVCMFVWVVVVIRSTPDCRVTLTLTLGSAQNALSLN